MRYIVGIDEVGRGPLAGPVTVCVVVCEEKMYARLKRDKNLPPSGKDSKKLSPEAREKYAKYIGQIGQIRPIGRIRPISPIGLIYSVVHVSNKIIDAKGISFAIKKAMVDGLRKLQKKLKLKPSDCYVCLDGGLKAPAEYAKQKTIIKGDEKEKIIAWASILAKVSRDALMRTASKKFPLYGFEIHKGYGTAKHRHAISTHGLSAFHRKSFCRFVHIDRKP